MAEIAGLKLIVPSSVAGSGVSVSASGKVSFTAATSVSVNGCFDSTYDNYLVVARWTSSANDSIAIRLRSSGTDATTTDYTFQTLEANSTTVSGGRTTSASRMVAFGCGTSVNGGHIYLYGPALSQPTAQRGVSASARDSARITEAAATHSLSTSYDGLTFYAQSASSITGSLCVYGLSQ